MAVTSGRQHNCVIRWRVGLPITPIMVRKRNQCALSSMKLMELSKVELEEASAKWQISSKSAFSRPRQLRKMRILTLKPMKIFPSRSQTRIRRTTHLNWSAQSSLFAMTFTLRPSDLWEKHRFRSRSKRPIRKGWLIEWSIFANRKISMLKIRLLRTWQCSQKMTQDQP